MAVVAFRADGGLSIGMGHIMRCLSLANELKRMGCEVVFLSRIETGINKIREEGFKAIELESKDLEDEADEISGFKEAGIELLIIDTYKVDEKYFIKLKPFVKKLAYIDDVNKFTYPVDLLVNGNITGKYIRYSKYKDEEVLLLGPQYNLIRREFSGLPAREINKEVNEIMLTTGGSDPHHICMKLIRILKNDHTLKRLRLNVIVGNAFDDREKLIQASEDYGAVVLYENVKYISEVMLRSDMAISSGGSTLYELCACGTPAFTFIMADNQLGLVEKMDELGYVKSLGWFTDIVEKAIIDATKKLCVSFEKRLEISRKMQELVDGEGARRVAETIMELLHN